MHGYYRVILLRMLGGGARPLPPPPPLLLLLFLLETPRRIHHHLLVVRFDAASSLSSFRLERFASAERPPSLLLGGRLPHWRFSRIVASTFGSRRRTGRHAATSLLMVERMMVVAPRRIGTEEHRDRASYLFWWIVASRARTSFSRVFSLKLLIVFESIS